MTTGSDRVIAEKCGVILPDTAQFEHNATVDGNPRVRIAQKKDHTCVYIKILNSI